MVVIHLIYDLTELHPVLTLQNPVLFLFFKNYGGIMFFLISGICATLGQRHVRRGMAVLGCAALVSAVTLLTGAMPIRFGVLHCLGLCMLLWSIFRRSSVPALCAAGITFVILGAIFERITVTTAFLFPLGLTAPGFESADFFPLLPYLGYFLLGAVLGRKLYPGRYRLFPCVPAENPIFRFFSFCGRHSLWIYLLHQPVILLFIQWLRR